MEERSEREGGRERGQARAKRLRFVDSCFILCVAARPDPVPEHPSRSEPISHSYRDLGVFVDLCAVAHHRLAYHPPATDLLLFHIL